jgi:hypothetical protein
MERKEAGKRERTMEESCRLDLTVQGLRDGRKEVNNGRKLQPDRTVHLETRRH